MSVPCKLRKNGEGKKEERLVRGEKFWYNSAEGKG
jgi:hypothetical protein